MSSYLQKKLQLASLTKAVTWTPSIREAVDTFVLGGGYFTLKKKGRIAFTEALQPNFCRLLVVHVKADMVAQTLCSWNYGLPFTKIYNIRNLTLSRANR